MRYFNKAGIKDTIKIASRTAPVDVHKIAETLNIQMKEHYDYESACLAVTSVSPNKACININSGVLYNTQKRYLIAHCIGHCCKCKQDNPVEFFDTKKTLDRYEAYWSTEEFVANSFAERLLMPTDLVVSETQKAIDEYQKCNGQDTKLPKKMLIEQLSDIFEVSNLVMTYKLERLNIIGRK